MLASTLLSGRFKFRISVSFCFQVRDSGFSVLISICLYGIPQGRESTSTGLGLGPQGFSDEERKLYPVSALAYTVVDLVRRLGLGPVIKVCEDAHA